METKLEMQDIQYMNLFSKITKVQASNCFKYNSHIVFVVKAQNVMRAVGSNGINVKRLSEILQKKVRVIQSPKGIQDARGFIGVIVKPITFKNIEITNNEIILTAGNTQNKAFLIGRNKRRFLEMQKIVKDFFNRDFKII